MNKNKKLFEDSKRVKQRYATRKLKVGMVSLLMGFTFIFGAAVEPVVKIMPRFAVDASEIGQDRSGARFDEYQHHYMGATSPRILSGEYYRDQQKIEDMVKVEKIGKENNNFEQKWKITYSYIGLGGVNGIPTFTNNPWNNFILSKDLDIVSKIKITMKPRDHQTNPNIKGGEPNDTEYAYLPEDFDGKYDNDRNVKISKESQIFGVGARANERIINLKRFDATKDLFYSRNDHFEIGYYFGVEKDGHTRFDKVSNGPGGPVSEEEHQEALDVMKYAGKVYRFQYDNNKKRNENQKRNMYYVTVEFTTKRDNKFYYNELMNNPNNPELKNFKSGVTGEYFSFDNNDGYIFLDMASNNIDYTTDRDKDGLLDITEMYLASNPYQKDTDGDKRLDGDEVKHKEDGTLADKVKRPETEIMAQEKTDPTVAPQYFVDKEGKPIYLSDARIKSANAEDRKLKGKIPYGNKTVVLRVFDPGNINDESKGNDGFRHPWNGRVIAMADSDDNGNYDIEIGKVFKKLGSGLNEIGTDYEIIDQIIKAPTENDLDRTVKRPVLTDMADFGELQSKVTNEDYFRLEILSDGWNNGTIFAEPEVGPYEKLSPKDPVSQKPSLEASQKNGIGQLKISDIDVSANKIVIGRDLKGGNYNNKAPLITLQKHAEPDKVEWYAVPENSDYIVETVPNSKDPNNPDVIVKAKNKIITAANLNDEYQFRAGVTNVLDETGKTLYSNDVVFDTTAPESPEVVEKVQVGDKAIKVKPGENAEKDDVITVVVNGQIVGEHVLTEEEAKNRTPIDIKVEDDLPDGFKAGVKINVIETDTAGNSSDPTVVFPEKRMDPVSIKPEIEKINGKNTDITVTNIDPNANKITFNFSDGIKPVVVEANEQGRWAITDNGGNDIEIGSQGFGKLSLRPSDTFKETLENKTVEAVTTNSNYKGLGPNKQISDEMLYDTVAKAPTKLKGQSDSKTLKVGLPDDITPGDTLKINIGDGIVINKELGKDVKPNSEIDVNLPAALPPGKTISATIIDKNGNESKAKSTEITGNLENVSAVPEIETINQDNKDIVINNIDAKANRITVSISDNEDPDLATLTSAGNNNKIIRLEKADGENWKVVEAYGNSAPQFKADEISIKSQGKNSVVLKVADKTQNEIQNKFVAAAACNKDVKDDRSTPISESVIYDTEVMAPVKVEAVSNTDYVNVTLPEDTVKGDTVIVKVDESLNTVEVGDIPADRVIKVKLPGNLSEGEKVSARIMDQVGNISTETKVENPDGSGTIPGRQPSAKPADLKQTEPNKLTVKVPKGTKAEELTLVDKNGDKIYGSKVESVDAEGVATVSVPNGINGAEVKARLTQELKAPTDSDLVTVDQHVDAVTIEKAAPETKVIEVKLGDDNKKDYGIEVKSGDEVLYSGKITEEQVNSKKAKLELNKDIAKDSKIDVIVTDEIGNKSTSTVMVTNGTYIDGLKSAIEEAEKVKDSVKYKNTTDNEEGTAEVKKLHFDVALDEAKEIIRQTNAGGEFTQKQINEAETELRNAMAKLNGVADKTGLDESIENANNLKKTDKYANGKPEDRDSLNKVLGKAEDVQAKADATQEEVDKAKEALDKEIAKFTQETDKKGLRDAIDAGTATQTKYKDDKDVPQDKKDALDKALEEGKKVNEDNKASQKDTDAAKDAIEKANKEIEAAKKKAEEDKKTADEVKVAKDELKKAIDDGTALRETDKYKNDEQKDKTALDSALGSGQTVFEDEKATKDAVEKATKAINDAIKNIDGKVNKDALKDAVDKAEETAKTDKYNNAPKDKKDKFDDALKKAKEGIGNDELTQADVDNLVNELKKAEDNLDGKANKDELNNAIKDAKNLKDKSEYANGKQDEKDALNKALGKAETVSGNDKATQDEVDKAKDELKEAMKPFQTATNKEALDKAITEGTTTQTTYKDDEDVPQDKKEALDKALEEGKKVNEDKKASQKKVDDATKAINEAKAAVEKAKADAEEAKKKAEEEKKAEEDKKAEAEATKVAKDALKAAIDQATKLKEKDIYKNDREEDKLALEKALGAGENVYADEKATKDAVEKATTDLNNAMKGIDGLNKEALNKAMADAKAVKETEKFKKADPDKIQALTDAEKLGTDALAMNVEGNTAEERAKSAEGIQKKLDEAAKAINEAIANLNGEVDTTKLDKAIADAKDIKTKDKFKKASSDKVEPFIKALENAEKVKADSKATQAEVDQAAEDLANATNALNGAVTKEDLANAIEDAKKIKEEAEKEENKNKVDPKDKENLDKAIKEAEDTKNDSNATEEQIRDAKDKVDEAKKKVDDQLHKADKKALEKALEDAAELKKTGKYKNGSEDDKLALEKAIGAGEAVKANEKATQEEVNKAAKDITNAMDKFQKATNKDALDNAITDGTKTQKDNKDNTDVPQDKKDALDKALENGKKVQEDKNASQKEVDDATNAINDAKDAVEKAKKDAEEAKEADEKKKAEEKAIKVAKDALKAAIDQATELKEKDIYKNDREEDKLALEKALGAGENVLADEKATKDDVEKATKDLNNAMKGIDGLNKEALNKAMADANAVKETDKYKKAKNQKALDDAFTNGEAVLAEEVTHETAEAVQGKIDKAAKEINEAIRNLDGQVDKTKLQTAIDNAKAVKNKDKYKKASDSTKEPFIEELQKANSVNDDSKATQAEVDQAEERLVNATKALNGAVTKEDLGQAIEDAKKTKEEAEKEENKDKVDPKDKENLDKAIKGAEDTKKDPDATDEQIRDAKDKVDEAKKKVDDQLHKADKKALEKALTDAAELKKTDKYKNGSETDRLALEKAIGAGEVVKANEKATQEEVNKAAKDITDAMNKFQTETNKEALHNAIEDGTKTQTDNKDNKDVPQGKKDALDKALEKGKEVQKDDKASQKEVDDATKAINDANKAIKDVLDKGTQTDKVVDTTELEKSIKEGKDLSEEVKKDDKLKEELKEKLDKLDEEIKKAEDTKGKLASTQDDIDNAKKDLDNAIKEVKDALKKKAKGEIGDAAEDKKKEIDKDAENKKNEIDKDSSKSDEDKQKEKDKVDEDAKDKKDKVDEIKDNADKDIDNADTKKDIDDIKDKAKDDIDKVGKDSDDKDKATDEDKKNAKKEVEDAANKKKDEIDKDAKDKKDKVDEDANKKKEEIDKDSSKSDEDKQKEKDKVNEDANKKKKEIDDNAKKDKEQVDKIKDKAKEDIDKADTKKEVNDIKDKAIDDIKNVGKDSDDKDKATQEDKDKAKNEVEDAANNKKDKIDKDAKDKKDKVDEDANKKKDEIDKDSSKSDEDKQKEKDKVYEDANKKKKEIDDNAKKDKEQVDKIKDKAKEDIDNADTKKEVNDIKDKAKEDIKNVGKDLDEDKKNAKKEVEDAANKKKDEIDDEAKKKKDEIDKENQDAKDEIDKDAEKQKEEVDKDAKDKKDEIDKDAEKQKEEIDKDSSKSDEDKQKEKDKVDEDANKKKDEIDKDAEKQKEDIDKDAKDKKDKLGKDKKDEIDKEAEKQKKEVDDIKKKADKDIDDAKTKDKVNEVKDKAIEDINNVGKDKTPGGGGSHGGGSSSGGSSSSGGGGGGIDASTSDSDRVSGSNRVSTAVSVSQLAYANGAKTVILANSEKFSDVLAAMPYGKTIKAPVLYTNFNEIPEETLKEIKRLGAEKVILIGGDQTISVLTERALAGMGYKTDRVNGKDRYETAQLIAERMRKAGAKGMNNVVIASGETFPDALSISPLAVNEETPILLARKDTLSKYTIKGLEGKNINRIYISGGNMSVSKTVEAKLAPYTKQAITRFAGHDRYETSAVIAKAIKPKAKTSVFASGELFADALVAGELVNHYDSPLLLVKKNQVPKSVEKYLRESDITKNVIVGGNRTISNEVVEKLDKIVKR